MPEDAALYETDGNVAAIAMNRPDKRSALSAEFKDRPVAEEGPAAAFRWRNARFKQ